MASRRFLFSLSRNLRNLTSNPSIPHNLHTIRSTLTPPLPKPPTFTPPLFSRRFSATTYSSEDDVADSDFESDDDQNDHLLTAEEIEKKADHIGYKVVGPVKESDCLDKPYEPVFAIVQVGAHQFKVSNGDLISTEKLKYCDVNEKLILNKVLMLGSRTQTIIGRPILPNASVYAVVEEHALDAKVIIFKKKRRKNYRRKNGHRQELTRLRIIDIQGIEKPEIQEPIKVESESNKHEKVAVAA